MGVFTQRPEEPAEWGGLPAESIQTETESERLRDAAPVVDIGVAGLFGAASADVTSIEIPAAPASATEDPPSGED